MSNICIFCGRSTKDAEVTYTQGDKPMCIAKFGLAVDRRGRDRGADFPNMIALLSVRLESFARSTSRRVLRS